MKLLFLLLFVLIAVPSQGKMTASEIKQIAFQKGVTKPHFYKIEYFGKTSYLLGTYHWGVSLDEFPTVIKEKAETADKLIVEILPSQLGLGTNLWCESNMEECLIQLNQNAPGRKMKKKYREALSPFISQKALKKMKSFFEISFPSNAWPALISEGGSLDFNLILSAINRGQHILALDTPQLRSQADNFAIAQGEKRLRIPKLIDLAKDAYEGDFSWYENQAQELADYRSGKVFMDSETSFAIAYRNTAWVRTLLEELKKSDNFIAVGIGHLYGDKGLIKLLRERNLRVESYLFQ